MEKDTDISKARSVSAVLRTRMGQNSFDFDERLDDLPSDDSTIDTRTVYYKSPRRVLEDYKALDDESEGDPTVKPDVVPEVEDTEAGESESSYSSITPLIPPREEISEHVADDVITEFPETPSHLKYLDDIGLARLKAYIGVISSVIGITVLILIITLSLSISGSDPFQHGVIIDAGSTHTQAILYKWLGSKVNGTGNVIQVAECTFTGAIASLPDPTVIIDCVRNVTEYIPDEKKASTSLYLAATAGMRLLNLTHPGLVNSKLFKLRQALHELDVDVKNVSVISGFYEGIYDWITVNYLMKILNSKNITLLENPNNLIHAYGTLDMGGASTQVAFSVDPSKTYISGQILPLELYGHKYKVFSMEYLCFGVIQAYNRHQALLIKNLNSLEIIEDPCLPEGKDSSVNAEILLGGPCTITEEFKMWLTVEKNRAKNFTFRGTSTYERCRQIVENVIDKTACEVKGFKICAKKINIPKEEVKFMAFSSFYYVTKFFNATDFTLPEFEKAVRHWCSLTWIDVDNFPNDFKILHHIGQHCFGAIYVQKWLTDIYGFNEDSWGNLLFQQKVDGTEIGWALGFMTNVTNATPAQESMVSPVNLTTILVVLLITVLLIVAGVCLMYQRFWNTPVYVPH